MMFSRWPCHYLKVPLKVGYHKIIKLIFYRQPPCPKKCVEKCPKKYGVFSGNFLILLEQRFYRTLLNICVLEFGIYLSKVKQSLHTESGQSGDFEFLFWFSSTIILSKIKPLFRSLCTSPNVIGLSIDYTGRYVLVYSFKFSTNKILRNSFSAGRFTVLRKQYWETHN